MSAGSLSVGRLTAQITIEPGFPVTVNDAAVTAWVAEVAAGVVGQARVLSMPAPVMGAEDFSYVLEAVPGAMVFLGTCPEGTAPDQAAPLHSNRMVLDETVMARGIAMHCAMAEAMLGGGLEL